MLDLRDRNSVADAVMLAEILHERKQVENIGGYGYIGELWDAAASASNAEYYAKIVRDRALVRGLIYASSEILRDAYDQSDSPEALIEQAERRIFALAEHGQALTVWTAAEAINETLERLQRRVDAYRAGVLTGIPSGFQKLDALTAGFQASELTIIGARPSVGKTAILSSIARHATMETVAATFFASLEQSRHELMERFACNIGRIDSLDVRNANLNEDRLKEFHAAADSFRGAPFWVDDASGQSVHRIAANARRLKRRHGLKLVLIDYLQLIAFEDRRAPQHEQLGLISRSLKRLARELEIPVVALAQLNRGSEGRTDTRPRLSDLRGSGELEQDADVVLLLHRESRESDKLEIMVEKQRNGPTGVITMNFDRRYFRFEEAQDWKPAFGGTNP